MTKKPSSHKISTSAGAEQSGNKVVTADGLRVFCPFTRLVKVAELKPDPENWNEHPASQLEMAAQIFERGIRRPIRVSARSGLITVGHGAYETARHKGWTEWPVEIQEYGSRADEIADLTADNQLGKKALANQDKLTAMLQQLTGEIDIQIAGVTENEFAEMIARVEGDTTAPLVPLKVVPPPQTAWVLVGIPITRWKEIAAHVEAIAKVEGIEYHSSTGTASIADEDG